MCVNLIVCIHIHISPPTVSKREALALTEYDAEGLATLAAGKEELKYRINLLEQVGDGESTHTHRR